MEPSAAHIAGTCGGEDEFCSDCLHIRHDDGVVDTECLLCQHEYPDYFREMRDAKALFDAQRPSRTFYKETLGIDINNPSAEDVEKLRRLKE